MVARLFKGLGLESPANIRYRSDMTTAVRKIIQEVQALTEAEQRELQAALLTTPVMTSAPTQPDVAARLAAVRASTQHSFPTGDITQVLAEIERGYRADPAR